MVITVGSSALGGPEDREKFVLAVRKACRIDAGPGRSALCHEQHARQCQRRVGQESVGGQLGVPHVEGGGDVGCQPTARLAQQGGALAQDALQVAPQGVVAGMQRHQRVVEVAATGRRAALDQLEVVGGKWRCRVRRCQGVVGLAPARLREQLAQPAQLQGPEGDTFDERFAFVGPCLTERPFQGTWAPPGDAPVVLSTINAQVCANAARVKVIESA